MNVKIRLLTPAAKVPTYATDGAAAFDLYAAEDVIIAPGETAKVPLGLAIEIPTGYEMQIRPRSGITLNTKLRVANSPATIDSDYRGEVAVLLDNLEPRSTSASRVVLSLNGGYAIWDIGERCQIGTYLIRAGDRIAQGVIAPVTRVSFAETDEELTQTERGNGGFGHTGTGTEAEK
ncbi:deoxyuridine 5'-triphosphate nucleotidohydrolase [Paenibacillus sp. BIHB 4019]|uniref:dUTP diphosphatase n=1 Tax=Paenibacillus sp. BIHB 4019 TaxID=1870819 RepID=A0A1B2DIZ8_9BACL|nr:deoxyuridine 5'-triphosphate nucleotidohydrolase [Paenibacillus sp. BIHB 4019]ANY67710.1 deoxyuridine 5'-triphosphate nucleotidohydrolase [Paenibacillus sp. BIHB 4019]